MNILFGVHGYKPAYRIGGPIYSVSALAEGLVGRGHKVVVFTSNSNLDEDLDVETDKPVNVNGVEVWYFRRSTFIRDHFKFVPYIGKSIGFLYSPRMRAELDRLTPRMDVLHTHMPFNYPSLAVARAAARFKKPLFYHQRGVLDPERLNFRALKKRIYIELIEKPILRSATSLIALTNAEKASYRALGIATPCCVVPNGIHVSKLSSKPHIEGFNIPDDAPVILFMGRMHPTKGVDVLLDAFIAISSVVKDSVLVLAGPDEHDLVNELKLIVRRHGLDTRVCFTGMVTGKRKASLLARADLFCLPSVAEGFSIAVLEALANGVPVILSHGCHFPEVEEYGAGRVVDRSSIGFSAAAIEMLHDRNQLKQTSQNAMALAETRYSWDRVVDQMIDVYKEGVTRHQMQTVKH